MIDLVMAALRYIAPYAAAFSVGMSVSWYIQGLRVDAANNRTEDVKREFRAYVLDAENAALNAKRNADIQREKASADYERLRGELGKSIKDAAVLHRCIAAGKCNGLRVADRLCKGGTVQAATGIDGSGSNTIPAAGNAPAVVDDCAITTLQLNQLQRDIASQDGY